MTLPRVLLDGPYGSPSEDAFNYEIAVLVGAGIGVTPFASVLKHIWYSVMQPTKIITLRKVYFLWVCRDRDVSWCMRSCPKRTKCAKFAVNVRELTIGICSGV